MASDARNKLDALLSALRLRYPPEQWALSREVSVGGRRADMVAVNLWPSRGYAVEGFELKISRADWLRELKKPAKADTLFSYCDKFWVVTPENVIRQSELPIGWGLLELRGGRLFTSSKATDYAGAKPIDREFLVALFRRHFSATEADLEAEVRRRVAADRKRRKDQALLSAEAAVESSRLVEQFAREKVRELTAELGTSDSSELRAAVRAVVNMRRKDPDVVARLQALVMDARQLSEGLAAIDPSLFPEAQH